MRARSNLAIAIDDRFIQFAMVDENRLNSRTSWPIERFSTLTDALMCFQREAAVALNETTCAIAVLGATEGDSILLSRGNWAISRSGLRALFRHDPLVLNDVAARAWAAYGGAGTRQEVLSPGHVARSFRHQGRWVLTKVEAGVGLASIDVDETGSVRVQACEMGHCGFAPTTAIDQLLASALSLGGPVTWEKVLTLKLDDPLWSKPGLPLTRASRRDYLARLLGRYVGETVLAHGAWSGAIITGLLGADLIDQANREAFNSAFEHKPKFAKLMRQTPRTLLGGEELTLHGCAVALMRQHASSAASTLVEI